MSIIPTNHFVPTNSMPNTTNIKEFDDPIQIPFTNKEEHIDETDIFTTMEASTTLVNMQIPSITSFHPKSTISDNHVLHKNEGPFTFNRCQQQTLDNNNPKTSNNRNKRTRSDEEKSNNNDEKLNHNNDGENNEEPKRKRRKNKKKPMDMPRRALSAYNIFFSEQRQLILEEIDRKAAQKEQPQPHGEQNYQQNDLEENNNESDSDSSIDDDNQKKVRQPETIPCVSKGRRSNMKRTKRLHRKVHGKISLVNMAREVGKRWKELSKEDRKYYEELASEDKIRHQQAMKAYEERKKVSAITKFNTQQLHHQQQQQQFPSTSPFMDYESMDETKHMMMMFDNHVDPSQQQQFHSYDWQRKDPMQQQQQQQQQQFRMIGQHSASSCYDRAYIMEQERRRYNRRRLIATLLEEEAEFGSIGSYFTPDTTTTFTAPIAPTPKRMNIRSSSTTAPTMPRHGQRQRSSIVPLTNLERRMIMKCRSEAAASTSKKNNDGL